ncbi:butyrophilin subfamily 1 member A1-like [Neolamprologus brichardi]|uniref:butyrophilin subfamily 1 member A1-like n=1 Tax=Neolamprologus brichardi TaxID=32507 RepID=UPI00164390E5|nr:butyrophilin subfamily 1 member A1-like [Neolamprologus brichardi]
MLHVKAGRDFMDLFDHCSVLVFYTAAVFALIHPCRGQSEVIGPLYPVVAWIGDDIILPCNLDPVMDALDMAVEWARPDLNPRFVFVWRDGVELESKKHPSYTNRTSLFTDELKNGNISLKISKVKLSDEGAYRCFFPELNKDTTVQLVVGAVSSPVISFAGLNKSISGVVLQCESAGWYPEPELLWLDGEGNLLSAGPTETLRGPDDLYTVSSRLTVEKRHSNNITCRVQQKKISQSRETHRHVPDDFFLVSPSGPPSRPISNPNVTVASAVNEDAASAQQQLQAEEQREVDVKVKKRLQNKNEVEAT